MDIMPGDLPLAGTAATELLTHSGTGSGTGFVSLFREREEVGMAAVYRRRKTWWISYSLDGKQRRESLCTRSRKVAERKLQQREEALESGTFRLPTKTTTGTFLERFRCHLKEIRSRKKSAEIEFNRVDYFFRRTGVGLLEDLTAATLAEYLERLAKAGRKGSWRPATYNRYREAFVLLFDFAIERCGFVSRDPKHENPARGLRRRKVPNPEIVYMTEGEIRPFLDELASHRQVQAMVATFIYGGPRRGEGLWLRKRDVDLARRTIRICSKEDKGRLWTPKTNADRHVPVSSELLAYLRAYEPPATSIWYFPSPDGRHRWNEDNFSHELNRLQRKYGLGREVNGKLRPYGCNVFRHTFATRLASAGKSLAQIARVMGNSPAICERHYAAFVTEELRDVVEVGPRPGGSGREVARETAPAARGKIIYVRGPWRRARRAGGQGR